MSMMRPVLNLWLRTIEKPHLTRIRDPRDLRHSFEKKAKLYFRAPFGSVFRSSRIADVPVLNVSARDVRPEAGPLMLYFHGGCYVFGSPKTHRAMLARLSKITGLPACLPDYRLAPEHPFPAALEDALAVYKALCDRPGGVILGGDSAGGGLVFALLADILAKGLPSPLGAFAFSPHTDFTFSGESFAANADADALLPAGRAREMAELYLADTAPDTPRASPLFADFTGAPPVWVTAGDTEILLDDTRRIAQRLRAQGVDVEEVIEADLPHVWMIFQGVLPEAAQTLKALAAWIRERAPG